MSDTPETDKLNERLDYSLTDAYLLMTQHSRKMERERDEAYAALISLRNGYGGQLADDECGCNDCEALLKIDAVLKKHEL